jgi:hypothetical protein
MWGKKIGQPPPFLAADGDGERQLVSGSLRGNNARARVGALS